MERAVVVDRGTRAVRPDAARQYEPLVRAAKAFDDGVEDGRVERLRPGVGRRGVDRRVDVVERGAEPRGIRHVALERGSTERANTIGRVTATHDGDDVVAGSAEGAEDG